MRFDAASAGRGQPPAGPGLAGSAGVLPRFLPFAVAGDGRSGSQGSCPYPDRPDVREKDPQAARHGRQAVDSVMAKKAKIRKNVVKDIAHVKATFNNTIITITDMNGATLAWDSAGTVGFKGARKSTPFAATRAAEKAAGKVKRLGMREVEVHVKGPGSGRESAVTGLENAGLNVSALEDHTPIPHNGCSPRKKRRV